MIQETVDVLWNEKLGDRYFRIGLASHRSYQDAEPGQFVMIRLMGDTDPLLRRPFSIHRQIVKDNEVKGIELLFKVVGKCTDRLSKLETGDVLDLLGPLGKGFRISETYDRVYLVAGGIGVAPLLFLALSLGNLGVVPSKCNIYLGGRTKEDLLCRDEFVNLGMDVSISTDDGSAGQTCLVTEPLEAAVKKEKPDIIFACGPENMLICVRDIAEIHGISCQISIETLMACGIGACLGCAVEARDSERSYLHACKDGPVFDSSILKYSVEQVRKA